MFGVPQRDNMNEGGTGAGESFEEADFEPIWHIQKLRFEKVR